MDERSFAKLGIKKHSSMLVFSPPKFFLQEIHDINLPHGSEISYKPDGMFDVVLIFARNQLDVKELAAASVAILKKGGNLWFAFPSKESQMETDLSESEGWATLVDSGWSKSESFNLAIGWTAIQFMET
ncbi:MAG: hypothetical protein ACJ0BG_06535 [Dehalococcoidia bacterium]|tara:strand:- start:1183 stop:1569 length:387 start_codon:yes stop_codon:yes gene_type:complete